MNIAVENITGVLGIVPTPAILGADHWSTERTVNLDETTRMVSLVQAAGIKIFLTNGTFGEGATLTFEDQQDFTDCILQSMADDGVPVRGRDHPQYSRYHTTGTGPC